MEGPRRASFSRSFSDPQGTAPRVCAGEQRERFAAWVGPTSQQGRPSPGSVGPEGGGISHLDTKGPPPLQPSLLHVWPNFISRPRAVGESGLFTENTLPAPQSPTVKKPSFVICIPTSGVTSRAGPASHLRQAPAEGHTMAGCSLGLGSSQGPGLLSAPRGASHQQLTRPAPPPGTFENHNFVYRSQVSPSAQVPVIGQDRLCVAQLHLFFGTQREPPISAALVPRVDPPKTPAPDDFTPRNLHYQALP